MQRASGPLKTRITDLNDDGFLTVLVPLLGDGETRWLKRRLFVLDTVFVLRIIFFFFFPFFWTNVSFDLLLRLDDDGFLAECDLRG